MFANIAPLSVNYPLLALTMGVEELEVCNFVKAPFFNCLWLILVFFSKKTFHNINPQNFPLVFSNRSFILLTFIFRSM